MKIELTTDGNASSYGFPVLRVDGVQYGPMDQVPCHDRKLLAGAFVVDCVLHGTLDRQAAMRFLAQAPEFSQLSASVLGSSTMGVPKQYSKAERARRRVRLAEVREKRWETKGGSPV
jgi:hypothetical protein